MGEDEDAERGGVARTSMKDESKPVADTEEARSKAEHDQLERSKEERNQEERDQAERSLACA